METFLELAAIISLATIISIFVKLLKQPLIVGYIITGILSGPIFLNLLKSRDQMELFSKIGISVLLFIVGLNLNPKVIKEVGRVSLITGVSQVIITSVIGFVIAKALGLSTVPALYVSIALTFSSTIIVLKLLSDKGDYHKLYGKIAVGFLIVQDVLASLILLLTTSFSSSINTSISSTIITLIIKSFAVGILLYLINSYLLSKIISFLASSSELLFLFSLSWGLGLASIFHLIGFSIEIGSLVAGVMLSLTPFAYEIASKLKPIRDFFIVLFFILLGSQMNMGNFVTLLPQALVLSLYVLIGNPLIVFFLVSSLGHKRKTSFMSALTVAQISEFSLILATLGVNLGHINQNTLSLITLVGIITIAGSSYLILYSEIIYPKLEWILKLIEFKKAGSNERKSNENYEILLFGYDRVGQDFVKTFNSFKKPFLVIDLNPKSIEILNKQNIPNRFGDAEDVDFLEDLGLDKVKLAISTIPDLQTNLCLTQLIKKANHNSVIIIVSHDLKEAKQLYDEGATYVVVPHYLGAKHITRLLSKFGINHSAFKHERDKHLEYIAQKGTLTN